MLSYMRALHTLSTCTLPLKTVFSNRLLNQDSSHSDKHRVLSWLLEARELKRLSMACNDDLVVQLTQLRWLVNLCKLQTIGLKQLESSEKSYSCVLGDVCYAGSVDFSNRCNLLWEQLLTCDNSLRNAQFKQICPLAKAGMICDAGLKNRVYWKLEAVRYEVWHAVWTTTAVSFILIPSTLYVIY